MPASSLRPARRSRRSCSVFSPPRRCGVHTFTRRSLSQVAKKIRFPNSTAFGIKPISTEGTARLVESALDYALSQKRKCVFDFLTDIVSLFAVLV